MGDELLSLAEAAEYSGLSRQTLYTYSNEGIIPVTKQGRNIFFRKDDLDNRRKGKHTQGVLHTEQRDGRVRLVAPVVPGVPLPPSYEEGVYEKMMAALKAFCRQHHLVFRPLS